MFPQIRPALRRLRPSVPSSVWIAAGLLFLVCALWATLTPGTRAPDESAHLNSILRVADGGGWPRPAEARVAERVLEMRELAGARGTVLPGSVNPAPGAPLWTSLPPTPPQDRPSLAELGEGGRLTDAVDQMTQHPPGYYAVGAVVFDLLGAEDWRYDHALLLLRLLTGLTIAASVPFCVYLVCRDLTGREQLARTASFLPLFIPQLGFIGGAVTNDGAAIAAAAVLTATSVRLMTAGPSAPRLVAVAVAAGATCWTKGTALPLLLLVPVAVAVAHDRHTPAPLRGRLLSSLRDTVAVLAAAFLLGGWWWALNLLRYGQLQPDGFEVPTNTGRRLLGFGEFLGEFADKVSASFFGYVGLLEAPLPGLLIGILTWGFLALLALGLVGRRRIGERGVFLFAILLVVVGLFVTTYRAHRLTHNFPGLQGRYLFVLLVPILVLVALGGARLGGWLRVPARAAAVLVPAAGVAVAAIGLVDGFELYYRADDVSLGRAFDLFLAWAPLPLGGLGLLGVAGVLLLLLLAFLEGRGPARRRERAGAPARLGAVLPQEAPSA